VPLTITVSLPSVKASNFLISSETQRIFTFLLRFSSKIPRKSPSSLPHPRSAV
jgi:hypothetical protein